MAGVRDYSVNTTGLIGATTGKVIVSGPSASNGPGGVCHGVFAISNATNTCVVTVYNSTAATAGTEVCQLSIPASTTPPQTVIFNNPIACPNGIYIVVTGTGAQGIVYYSLGS